MKVAEAFGVKALAVQADSGDAQCARDAVDQAASELGGLDILVDKAGVLVVGPLDEFKLEDFVFVAVQSAARHMTNGGRIINIGSTNADRMTYLGGGGYAMTKSALQGLVQGLSRDLGPRGITINNVQPGPVDTEMNPANGPSAEALKGFMALSRYGATDEIAFDLPGQVVQTQEI